MRHNKAIKALVFLSMLFVFVGCGQQFTRIDLTITSGNIINPNEQNISYPLILRFYELSEADKFAKLNFEMLIDEPAKQLGDTMISHTKHVILRNKIQSYKIRFNEKTKYMGIVGSFRKLNTDGSWKYIKVLNVGESNCLELLVDGHSIKKED
jgi:type VI secretion system protein VasD